MADHRPFAFFSRRRLELLPRPITSAEQAMAAKKRLNELPPSNDWRTTDEQEIERRQLRAKEERFQIVNSTPNHPIFSTFQVASGSGRTYAVEIRGLGLGEASCGCVDFSSNGLGTCKHVEAVRLKLGRRERAAMAEARRRGSNRWEVIPDRERGTLRLLVSSGRSVPESLREWFDAEGFLIGNGLKAAVEELEALTKRLATLRISQDVEPWVRSQLRAEERTRLRRDYEVNVQTGVWPPQETRVPLFPYQREGMLHLAFTERALLADEMGLGKTIQAIAACALLARLGQVRRVLVVTPASLKVDWEEQIQRFTNLSVELAYGGFHQRMKWLREGAATDGFRLFTVVNYEQVVPAVDEFNELHSPDVVILDEAQRIKNWNSRIAKTIKRLKSRYAFVLTGTPIENRIDELRSLVDFLDPSVLGPLFRFNREFYDFDERGRPAGYRNLHVLHQRVRPILLRRRKADVETELPARTDRNLYVKMTPKQRRAYGTHEQEVVRLVQIAERRLLTQREQDFLQIQLAMMRMICDTNYILDSKDRECPKLAELSRILEDCIANDAKVIVFSEWERMLELVRDSCEDRKLAVAWHTGSVPQKQRRTDIQRFKDDPPMPGVSDDGCGSDGAEPTGGQCRGELRFAVESGEAGTTDCSRLAEAPNAAGDCPQSDHRRFDRAAHVGDAGHQADGGGECIGSRGKCAVRTTPKRPQGDGGTIEGAGFNLDDFAGANRSAECATGSAGDIFAGSLGAPRRRADRL